MNLIACPNDGLRQLVEGYRRFFNGDPVRRGFCAIHAEQIANTQAPHSMVVSCFDSRVCPEAIFNTNDGHICVHRNMLNQIDQEDFSMMASLRFAVENLKVQNEQEKKLLENLTLLNEQRDAYKQLGTQFSDEELNSFFKAAEGMEDVSKWSKEALTTVLIAEQSKSSEVRYE